MLVIGMTGGLASGKSTVARLFQQDLGIDVINADTIAKQLTQPDTEQYLKIIDYFGKSYILENKQLNRYKLRQLIFTDNKAKQWLETLLHPAIRADIINKIANTKPPYCIIEIPLLAESSYSYAFINRCLVIDSTKEQQIARAIHRDKTSYDSVIAILNQQATREQRLAIADDIIDNNGDETSLINQVSRLHDKYLDLGNI